MRRAFLFISVHKRVFSFIAALFLSVLMMIMDEGQKINFAKSVTTTVFNTGRFTFSWGIYILDLWHENKRLRLQNLVLTDQISRHDFAILENERLRRMLSFREKSTLSDSVIAGTVLGHDFDRIVNTLIVDIGERDGVKKNMAVITAEGLVGKVYEVYRTSCSVQVIMDVNSRISGVAGGINGIIRWEGGPYLKLYGLPLSTIPKAGEKVYTTGLGVFPGGILIGTVTSPRYDEVERYASVNVESEVDFSSIQEVFIIRGSERSDIWNDGEGTGKFQRPEIE